MSFPLADAASCTVSDTAPSICLRHTALPRSLGPSLQTLLWGCPLPLSPSPCFLPHPPPSPPEIAGLQHAGVLCVASLKRASAQRRQRHSFSSISSPTKGKAEGVAEERQRGRRRRRSGRGRGAEEERREGGERALVKGEQGSSRPSEAAASPSLPPSLLHSFSPAPSLSVI